MLKKTITYPDLDGNPVTEVFYFNLSKAEIAEMELRHQGGLGAYLQRIVESQDGAAIIDTFKDIIRKAIGRRSEDGRRFVKSEEIADDFMQTEAYSQLFMELVTNADAAANFINAIVPADMEQAIAQGRPIEDVDALKGAPEKPLYQQENREPTQKELTEMNDDELREAFRFRQELYKSPEGKLFRERQQ